MPFDIICTRAPLDSSFEAGEQRMEEKKEKLGGATDYQDFGVPSK